MNYATVRDRIKTLLESVSGIGKVYGSPRHTNDWPGFLQRFAVVHPNDATRQLICVCWMTRIRAIELSESKTGSRDEANVLTGVERDEDWEITLVVGFQDDDTNPSEDLFQVLVDSIQEKFRWQDQLGIPSVIFKSYPLDLTYAGLAMFGNPEGVLCHKATFMLHLEQRDDTV